MGNPAIESKAAVKIPASNGCDFPNPLKASMVSFSLLLVTNNTTAKNVTPANA